MSDTGVGEFRIEVRRSVLGTETWDLFVNGKPCVTEESYAVCDQVRAALNGERWPCGECQEVAASIRKAIVSS